MNSLENEKHHPDTHFSTCYNEFSKFSICVYVLPLEIIINSF